MGDIKGQSYVKFTAVTHLFVFSFEIASQEGGKEGKEVLIQEYY